MNGKPRPLLILQERNQTCQVLKMGMSETIAYHTVCRTVRMVWHTIIPYICSGWIDMAIIMGGLGVLPQFFLKFSFQTVHYEAILNKLWVSFLAVSPLIMVQFEKFKN